MILLNVLTFEKKEISNIISYVGFCCVISNQTGKAELFTEDAATAIQKAGKLAQAGFVVSVGVPIEATDTENANKEKMKVTAEAVCREKNAELARYEVYLHISVMVIDIRHEISLRIRGFWNSGGGGGGGNRVYFIFIFLIKNLTLECIKTAVFDTRNPKSRYCGRGASPPLTPSR